MALSLAGKTAIITGAGSGINLAFARSLLGKRCNVLFADIALRPEAQELILNTNTSRSSAKAVFQHTEVRDWPQLEHMFRVAEKEFGGVDIVCPGAGPWSNFWHPPGYPPSVDLPISNSYGLLDINLAHPIRTTQLALLYFLKSSRFPKPISSKFIVHISSIAGQTSPLTAPIYNATKHAINGFVRSLAPLDKRLGVRVTAIAPGVILTPSWTENPDKLKLVTQKDMWITPEFVADVMTSLVEGETVEAETREGNKKVAVEGGMILEVAKHKVRIVEQFNDPGPCGEGNTVGNLKERDEEIFEMLGSGRWGID